MTTSPRPRARPPRPCERPQRRWAAASDRMRERLSRTITVLSDRSEKSAVFLLASFLFLRWAVRRRHRRGRIVSLTWTCSAGAASAVAAWNAGLACRRVGGDPARSLTGSERQFCNMATASTTIAARPRSCAPSRASGRTELYQCSYGRRSTRRAAGDRTARWASAVALPWRCSLPFGIWRGWVAAPAWRGG